MEPVEPFVGGRQRPREHLNRLVGLANSIATIKGDGPIMVTQAGTGVTIGLDMAMLARILPRNGSWARITGSITAETPTKGRYKYAWEEVWKPEAGYGNKASPEVGGWATVSGGLEGLVNGVNEETADDRVAYNTIEDVNIAFDDAIAGDDYGNGVEILTTDVDGNDTQDYPIAPLGLGAVVWLWEVQTKDADGKKILEYWFQGENALTGECPEA